MAVLDKRPAGRTERIDLAVQRELARRRRLLLVYLALLLIPLGIGAWLLAAGRSDQAAMQEIVQQRVAPVEQRYQELAPQLARVKDLDTVLPAVKSAAREIEAQKVQVEKLAQGQEMLQRQVVSVNSNIRELAPRIQELNGRGREGTDLDLYRRLQAENAALRDDLKGRLDALAQNVNTLREAQTGLADQQKLIAGHLEQLQKEKTPPSVIDFEKLDARLSSIEKNQAIMKEQVKQWTVRRPPG